MSEVLRELERAHRADPTDKTTLERLQDERVRRGLGWHGEELPQNDRIRLVPLAGERGVYVVKRHDSYYDPGAMQLVYVPGRGACGDCSGEGIIRTHVPTYIVSCPCCRGTGRRVAFYIGRFPVTIREWMASIGVGDYGRNPDRLAHLGKRALDKNADYPVVDVSFSHVKEFCSWAGLRLPTDGEWEWAALGGLTAREVEVWQSDSGNFTARARWERVADGLKLGLDRAASSSREAMARLADDMRGFGLFPWGPEPPTPERCVWAGHPEFGPNPTEAQIARMIPEPGMIYHANPGSTAPVVEWLCPSLTSDGYVRPKPGLCVAEALDVPADKHSERCRLVPGRPQGISWCGAHDMIGNVCQITDGYPMGFSFKDTPDAWLRCGRIGPNGADDVGFRVALSGASG